MFQYFFIEYWVFYEIMLNKMVQLDTEHMII